MKNGIDRRKLIIGVPALLVSSPVLAARRKHGAATLSQCVSPPNASAPSFEAANASKRPTFTSEDQESAIIPGFPQVRFWANSEDDYARAVPSQLGPWLALSTGAEDGAYGAGFLNGWTASGQRPEFSVVTGVSSGAIIAIYAFAGPKYDDILRKAYTSVRAADIFEVRATPESIVDTWPLERLVQQHVTPELLADVAAQHRQGRRLFVVTTNLDAGRAMVWDMGAIAVRGGEPALVLFRKVVLASSSIPAVFPPVLIEAEANGRRFQEMHVDGGVNGPIYVAPESYLFSSDDRRLPASELYIVVNGKLSNEFDQTGRTLPSILGRSFSVALKLGARTELFLLAQAAQRNGIDFKVTLVETEFDQPERGVFDPQYMQALFDRGVARGQRADFQHSRSDYVQQSSTKCAAQQRTRIEDRALRETRR
jgi:predicted acylesterase/phospholipase RssA